MILGALLACEDDPGIIITALGMHANEFSKNINFPMNLNDFT